MRSVAELAFAGERLRSISATQSTITAVDPGIALLAAVPIVLLLVLVASGRVRTSPAAALTLATTVLLATLAFGASAAGLGVGLAKGAWTGLWILGVVWTALLLHATCQRMGMDRLGGALSSILPRSTQSVLVVAWVFPSFVQGVAGFGTPIAVAAPLLVSMGVRPALAVAMPLIGYHWSVGFGSVGSSFYMGALTAQLSESQIDEFAATTSLILGINAIVAGMLVALMFTGWRGLREAWTVVVIVGPTMAIVQALVVRVEPGVGALAGGAAGLTAVTAISLITRRAPREGLGHATKSPVAASVANQGSETVVTPGLGAGGPSSHPEPVGRARYRRLALVLLPYGLLLVSVLAVLVPPASRSWARSTWTWGPSFSATSTAEGGGAEAVVGYQPISVFAHPGSFILFATLAAVLIWRLSGRWPAGALPRLVPTWSRSALKASWSVLLLASVATVMADTGMIRALALGIEQATGRVYPALAGVVGALGSFTTGSTTSSNALFSAMQVEVAGLIDVSPTLLLAAQISGGNVGNAVAPVILLMGAAAVGAHDKVSEIFRLVRLPAAVLLLVVMATTVAVVQMG
jgi:lactate permease